MLSFLYSKKRNVLTTFVEVNETTYFLCYSLNGDLMKDEILINDVLKDVDKIMLKLDTYLTLKNIKRKSKRKNVKR